ncbi:MAG: ABC transporter permease [Ancalomicrobiaceae bacterium]|nr:ABC transporter permease [Ancalomicrobiaceae bacterium]
MTATTTQNLVTERITGFLRDYGALLGMLIVLLIVGALKPSFLSTSNLTNVLRQSTILIMLSLGLTIVMSMRGVDLSIAQIADAAGLMAAMLILHGQPAWMALIVPVVFGLGVGAINGALMAYLGVPAIIGTLGMMFVIRSGELLATNGAEPQMLFTLPRAITKSFLFLGQGYIGPVSALVVLAAVVVMLAAVLMHLTPFARRAHAVGANVRAAFLAGIDIRGVFGLGYVVAGVFAAIAGVALVSRTGIAVPRGAEPYLLDAFAAAYLGTLASRHGDMNVGGTLIGALFIAFLGNGLTILGLGAPYRYTLNGAFILLAMAVGALKRKS